MKPLFVSAVAALALAVCTVPAAAQLRVGATVRVSDRAAIGVSLGHRGVGARLYYHDRGYRGDRAYWRRVARQHARQHRRLDREHARWHRELAREHDALHRALRHGRIGWYEHDAWHEAVGYDHDAFHHALEYRHDRQHRGSRPNRHSHR